jgi:hypothetical protein
MFLSYQNHSSNRQLKLVLKTRNRVVYKGRISQLTVVLHSILADRHLKMCVGGYKFRIEMGDGRWEMGVEGLGLNIDYLVDSTL